MHEAVLMYANVYERAEVRHVRHDARTHHPRRQISDLVNVFAESEGGKLFARITSWFAEFGYHISKGKLAEFRFQFSRLLDELNPQGTGSFPTFNCIRLLNTAP